MAAHTDIVPDALKHGLAEPRPTIPTILIQARPRGTFDFPAGTLRYVLVPYVARPVTILRSTVTAL